MILILSLLLAQAAPPRALSPTASRIWEQAEAREARGAWLDAARVYETLWRSEGRIEAQIARAWALHRGGRTDEALDLLRALDPDRDARVERASILLDDERWASAASVLDALEAGWGADPEIARLRVRAAAALDPEDARARLERWLGFHVNAPLSADHVRTTTSIVASSLLEAGRPDLAVDVIDRAVAVVPETAHDLHALRADLALRATARRLARVSPSRLDRAQVLTLQRARSALSHGRVAEAEALLQSVADDAPYHPEVRGLLAHARLQGDHPERAEVDLHVAEALDPLDPRWPTALGDLLDRHYGGRFEEEAFAAWSRALRLRPDQPALRLRWAKVGARLGRVEQVVEHLHPADSARDPSGAAGLEALRVDLRRPRLEPPPLPEGSACPSTVGEDACDAFYLAYVAARRDAPADPDRGVRADLDRAFDALQTARTLAPDWSRPLNLRASLLLDRPDGPSRADAVRLLERSLDLDPDQPEIEVLLGTLYAEQGRADRAEAAWRRAAATDSSAGAPAHVFLAERAWRAWRPFAAWRHLDMFRSRALPGAYGAAIEARADDVRQRVERLRDGSLALGVAVFGVLVLIAVVIFLRRARRRTVSDLLAHDPRSWREVARIVTSIRHEVLKHHLGALGAVADALDRGDPAPGMWLAERLGGEQGPIAQADRRLAELRALGRAQGIFLDLQGFDPVFSPLYRALRELKGLRSGLLHGRASAEAIRRIDDRLREQVQSELRELVARACALRVDVDLLDDVRDSVLSEASATWRGRVDITNDAPPDGLVVRAFRDDLSDVLCNLIRNAAAASFEAGEREVRVRATVEIDEITALEQVVLRVADRAPRRISTAMLRSRYIGRGLGLTVDRVATLGGSIAVEDEPGFSKAVVVRLPRLEAAQELA